MSPDRYQELLVKTTDQVASPAEREELMAWVVQQPELQKELESHMALKAVTDGWMLRLEADLAEDRSRRSTGGRLVRVLGVLALVLGYLLLVATGLQEALTAPDTPLGIQLGLVLGLTGLLALLLHTVIVRIRNRAHDPYTKVIR